MSLWDSVTWAIMLSHKFEYEAVMKVLKNEKISLKSAKVVHINQLILGTV